ncbi:MAG: M20/M25/M40 family metallo-hydrolase [Planctomycetaceae bacterium]|nr:M20/M25/M40 family metallo-hydrolase [Planctomycetaceae bacterium]
MAVTLLHATGGEGTSARRCRATGNRRRLVAFTCLLLANTPLFAIQREPCPPAPPVPVRLLYPELQLEAAQVRSHVEFLASPELMGRGARGKELAREYILRQFQQAGLQPLFGESFLQRIPDWRHIDDERPVIVGANLGAYIPASDPNLREEWIILSAHYDHLGMREGVIYPGADDNATGVAMLLEVARAIAASPQRPSRNIAFVAFDFEERLLWGSRWFVSHPPCELEQIRFFLTADMLGRSLGNLPMRSVFVIGSEHAPELRTTVDACNPTSRLELALLGADMVGTRSDYGPFRDQEIPFLFFSTGEHPDYHTPRDTPDRVDYDKLADVSTLIGRLTLQLSRLEQVPQWHWRDPRDLIDAQTMHRVTGVLLQADETGEFPLGSVHRVFVSQLHAKTGYAVRQGRISYDERTWLIRAAQILLFTVF